MPPAKPLQKLTADIVRNPLHSLLFLSLAGAVIVLLQLYSSLNDDDGAWEQFKIDHHCQLQTNQSGTQRHSWLCDDGKLYYRWRQQR
ncbi:hypothetical protein JCM14076_24690 [Methylosoma difficile]